MEVGTEGWKTKVYAVDEDRAKKIVKRREDLVEIDLEEGARNPIYWFRNKDDIIASIKKLVKFGSIRYQEFMNQADAIERGHQESSTELTDLNHDMLVEIMNQASPESWANLMLAANEPIPADQRKPVFRPDGTSYIPKYRRNSRLWDEKVTREKCDEFLQNNGENNKDFCMSKEPVHQICRYRTDRCNTVYGIDQQEVIPIPGQTGAYRIKDGVTSIAEGAFKYNYNLKSMSIPDSVTEIGTTAFYDSSIRSVKISEYVTYIPYGTFSESRLESVIIPNSVTDISSWAFDKCKNLETVKLSESLTDIKHGTFYSCRKLKAVIIPDSVESIFPDAFHSCVSLQTIKLSESLTFIGSSAFRVCIKLKSVIIPDSVTKIEIGAFSHCSSLETITISKSLKSIDTHVFYGCEGLKSVTIPESVETIERGAFEDCKSLKSVTIPESVKYISFDAFKGCDELDDATIQRIDKIHNRL